jgi:TonB family protein
VLFRLNAVDAPSPEYPRALLQAGKHGLVVVEVAVSAAGRVMESAILESFDEKASAAVVAALNGWRFHTEDEMIASGILEHCKECIRINRLGFDFRIERGAGRVVDLVEADIKSRGVPDPFQKQKRR